MSATCTFCAALSLIPHYSGVVDSPSSCLARKCCDSCRVLFLVLDCLFCFLPGLCRLSWLCCMFHLLVLPSHKSACIRTFSKPLSWALPICSSSAAMLCDCWLKTADGHIYKVMNTQCLSIAIQFEFAPWSFAWLAPTGNRRPRHECQLGLLTDNAHEGCQCPMHSRALPWAGQGLEACAAGNDLCISWSLETTTCITHHRHDAQNKSDMEREELV